MTSEALTLAKKAERLKAEIAEKNKEERLALKDMKSDEEKLALEAQRIVSKADELRAEIVKKKEEDRLVMNTVKSEKEKLALESQRITEQNRIASEAAELAKEAEIVAVAIAKKAENDMKIVIEQRLAAEAQVASSRAEDEKKKEEQKMVAACGVEQAAKIAEEKMIEEKKLAAQRVEAAEAATAKRAEEEKKVEEQRLAAIKRAEEEIKIQERKLAVQRAEEKKRMEQQRLATEAQAAKKAEEEIMVAAALAAKEIEEKRLVADKVEAERIAVFKALLENVEAERLAVEEKLAAKNAEDDGQTLTNKKIKEFQLGVETKNAKNGREKNSFSSTISTVESTLEFPSQTVSSSSSSLHLQPTDVSVATNQSVESLHPKNAKEDEEYQKFIATVHDINEQFGDQMVDYAKTLSQSTNNIALSISQASSSLAASKFSNKLSTEEIEKRLLLLKKTLNVMI